ncbi:MAG: MFS transporter [Bacilli bacterium]
MSETKQAKKSGFDSPLLSTKVKSANVKIFPEAGLGYFVGPTLALLSNAVLNTYLNKYFTDVLQLTKWASLFSIMLPIVSVIAIVIGNILVGKLMDHSRSKAGKARPLLLIALPLIALAILAMFLNPFAAASDGSLNVGSIGILIWVAIAYNLYYAVAYPFYYTSHSALINLSTRNSKHRGLLGTVSMATGLAAVGVTSMILPFFIDLLFVTDKATGAVDFAASNNAWKIFTIALVVISALGILLEYYFTRERITEEQYSLQASNPTKAKKPATTKQQAKACMSDKYWWIIILLFFFYQLGGMLKNNSQLYFCQAWFTDENGLYSIATGGQRSGTISILGSIPTALGMLIVWPIANKIGKSKTIVLGGVVAVLGGLIGIIDPSNFGLVCASFIVKALGGAPAMYISMALLADVLDHNEAVHGFRSDGLTMTIYGAIMIGMNGIANGIINGLLSATGYNSSSIAGFASDGVRTAMSWAFIGGETICYGIIALIVIFMGVEKFSAIDHKAIVEDQKKEALEQGVPYVEPSVRLAEEQAKAEEDSEKAFLVELERKCQKKNLNFEEEKNKYFTTKAENEKKAADKKALADAKKLEQEKTKAELLLKKEEDRKTNLKAKCEAEHLDFNEEEKKYEDAKKQALEEKKKIEAAKEAEIETAFLEMRAKARGANA